jgi:murein DD-endopeptidase MepM/ murein hydrolase activator NlpD
VGPLIAGLFGIIVVVSGLFAAPEPAMGTTAPAPQQSPEPAATTATTPELPDAEGKVCPLTGPLMFRDTWGAPRPGDHRHIGTDVYGEPGAAAQAITGGRIAWTGARAQTGLELGLHGDDGHRYWYLHLVALDVSEGDRVAAGDVLGRVGDSARTGGGAPYLHLEVHPDGGALGAVNPYPLLQDLCG